MTAGASITLPSVPSYTLDLETVPSPSDEMFGFPSFPSWVKEFRESQWSAVVEVLSAYEKGARFVFLDAPTGTGKTLIGETVRRLMRAQHTSYICTTKTLQDQFIGDFSDYAKVLKGRSNYPTHDYPERFGDRFDGLSTEDCMRSQEMIPACDGCLVAGMLEPLDDEKTESHCPWCHPFSACSYQNAKNAALNAPLCVLNTAYLLAEANTAGLFSSREFIIADECDVLESTLMSYAEVKVTKRWRAKFKMDVPKLKTKESAWAEWVENEAIPKVQRYLANLHPRKQNVQDMREFKTVSQILVKLRGLQNELVDDGNWVYTGYEKADKSDHDIVFRPVRVDGVAPGVLWKHSKRWLLMSATIIDPAEQAEGLGIPEGEWEVVSVPNTFPKERRPIYIKPVANMTHKNKIEAYPKMAAAIIQVVLSHPDDRVLVHTVSYDLTQYLEKKIRMVIKGRPILVYSDAREREVVLRQFRANPGAVLLAPSFDRGVDLPQDDCRVQVICKMPFASLGDKQVQRRLYSKGGDLWYSANTVRSLVQMTGRGMRSADDFCETYILDQQFHTNVWKKSRRLIPKWWAEAIDWSGGTRRR